MSPIPIVVMKYQWSKPKSWTLTMMTVHLWTHWWWASTRWFSVPLNTLIADLMPAFHPPEHAGIRPQWRSWFFSLITLMMDVSKDYFFFVLLHMIMDLTKIIFLSLRMRWWWAPTRMSIFSPDILMMPVPLKTLTMDRAGRSSPWTSLWLTSLKWEFISLNVAMIDLDGELTTKPRPSPYHFKKFTQLFFLYIFERAFPPP